MKAAYIEQVGPPQTIQYGDLPMPTVGRKDILVKVEAVTVNGVDTSIRSGRIKTALSFPFIIGRDMVGIVTQIGEEVTFVPVIGSGPITRGMMPGKGRLQSVAGWMKTSSTICLPASTRYKPSRCCIRA